MWLVSVVVVDRPEHDVLGDGVNLCYIFTRNILKSTEIYRYIHIISRCKDNLVNALIVNMILTYYFLLITGSNSDNLCGSKNIYEVL